MIINIRAKNCFVFENQVELNMKSDLRTKKFGFNVYKENNFNILKSVGIYGPNNVGKTCLLKCIRNIKNVILNQNTNISSNIFSDSKIAELGVTFLESGKKYSYDFQINTEKKEFIYEKFSQIAKDSHGNEKEELIFLRDSINEKYIFIDKSIQEMMKLISKNNILIHLIGESKNKNFEDLKKILMTFVNKIECIDMNNIPIQKTISLLKNENNMQKKIVNFIMNSDLDMDNYQYSYNSTLDINLPDDIEEKTQENVLNVRDRFLDLIRLTSVYKGKPVPSLLFDSTGTKKIVSLSSYIIEALEEGKILVIDELDSSIHFKLARAIVSMFNNELNLNSQLIFSVHDINLMDCKKLFRKEQIWFVHKDEAGVYLYPLSDFTAAEGIRNNSDIIHKYKKGILGAIPDPKMIDTLLEVENAK